MWMSVTAVAIGAALGALARWGLSLSLNSLFPAIPPGTVASNLIGGYLIGIAAALFAQNPAWPVEWRLFAVTGFLGGLTTFSTFSAEVVFLLQQGRLLMAASAIGVHLFGSLLCTLAGFATVSAWVRSS